MTMVELETTADVAQHGPTLVEQIDRALSAQIVVAWAGEGGETPRLGWWRSDLSSEFGGHDLFARLLPYTWEWAVLEAVREAAVRKDAALRQRHHDPDQVISLFHLGFEIDEAISERLSSLKRTASARAFGLEFPSRDQALEARAAALPGLHAVIDSGWDQARFLAWVREQRSAAHEVAPTGRLLRGNLPRSLDALVQALVGGLDPLVDSYPLPHYLRDPKHEARPLASARGSA